MNYSAIACTMTPVYSVYTMNCWSSGLATSTATNWGWRMESVMVTPVSGLGTVDCRPPPEVKTYYCKSNYMIKYNVYSVKRVLTIAISGQICHIEVRPLTIKVFG